MTTYDGTHDETRNNAAVPEERDGTDPSRRETPPHRMVVHPETPLATRVNRNVLVVAAVIMAITVVTAVLLLNPTGPKRGDTKGGDAVAPSSAGPSSPTFLEHPLAGGLGASIAGDSEKKDLGAQPQAPHPGSPAAGVGVGLSDPYTNPSVASTAGQSPTPSLRETTLAKALLSHAGVSLGDRKATSGIASENLGNDSLQATAADDLSLKNLGAIPFGSPEMAASTPGTNASRGSPRQPDQQFLDGVRNGTHTAGRSTRDTLTTVTTPRSPYLVQAGSVIPGLLITGINSDLPGQIVAQVSRDVYDSPTEQALLIPRGSKLLATYNNEVLAGQNRVLVAFTRIIFPDGRSVLLPGLGGTDRQGAAGLSDHVDNHTRHTFGAAVLLSLISAAAQLSQPRTGSSIYAPASPGQVAAGAVGQELADVASQMMRRNLDVAPTLIIRPGTPCNVFLADDLVFNGPYVTDHVEAGVDARVAR